MVAYSFKKQFVAPIKVGLGKWFSQVDGIAPSPKRQTIRAVGLKRHARPGDEIQLYCGLRTRHSFLIGRSRCISVQRVALNFHFLHRKVSVDGTELHRADLDDFARRDGFSDYVEMRAFWAAEHSAETFTGILIRWEPL